MSRPKETTFGEYTFVHKYQDVTDFDSSQLVGRSPAEVRQTAKDILAVGVVIYDIIMTRYNGIEYLMDGAKRILACQQLLEDGEVQYRQIQAKVFLDLDPNDTAAWSIILNEQRSDNPIMAWQAMRILEKEGKWKELAILHSFNKARFIKLSKLNNLIKEKTTLKAYQEGKIALGTLFQLASLGRKHQEYCHKVLRDNGKLTGNDIKAARTARATAILAEAPKINMSLPNVTDIQIGSTNIEPILYVVLKDIAVEGLYEDYHLGKQKALESEGTLYRLIKVG